MRAGNLFLRVFAWEKLRKFKTPKRNGWGCVSLRVRVALLPQPQILRIRHYRLLLTETLALAKATAADPFSGLPDQSDLAQDVPDLDLTDTSASLTLEEKLARAQEAEESAFASDSRITNSEGAEFANASREMVYANSLGFCGSYHTTSFSLSVVSSRFPRRRDAARLLVFITTETQGS